MWGHIARLFLEYNRTLLPQSIVVYQHKTWRVQSNLVASQHCLASSWRQTNIKISQDLESLFWSTGVTPQGQWVLHTYLESRERPLVGCCWSCFWMADAASVDWCRTSDEAVSSSAGLFCINTINGHAPSLLSQRGQLSSSAAEAANNAVQRKSPSSHQPHQCTVH